MQLSPQAWTITIVYGILTIVFIVTLIKQFSLYTVFAFIIWIVYYGIEVYDTNCLTVGECSVWSWIRTAFNILIPSIIIIIMTIALFTGRFEQEEQEEDNGNIVYQEK